MSIPNLRSHLVQRIPAAAGFLVLLALFLVGVHRHGTVLGGWEQLRAPVSSWGPWEDTRVITDNIDCKLRGENPYRSLCTPGERPYNYPPIWLKLRYFGIHAASAPMLAWTFAACTVLVYVLLLRTTSILTALTAFLAIVLSNPLILALERGNSDELILFLLVLAFYLSSRLPQRQGRLLVAVALPLLTILKIYPVAATISLMRRRRDVWVVLGSGAASVILLVVTAGSDLVEVFRTTPTQLEGTFGVIPAVYWAGRVAHLDLSLWVEAHRAADFGIAAILFACCAALGAAMPARFDQVLSAVNEHDVRSRLALACAGIFCFAFAGGASYNYRLIFLTPVLAHFLESYDSGKKGMALIPAVILAFVAIPYSHGRPREAADVVLFAMFAAWIGVSVRGAMQRAGDEAYTMRHHSQENTLPLHSA